jgi:hypothetical protein
MTFALTVQTSDNRSVSVTPGNLTATGRVSPVLAIGLTIKVEGASVLRLDHLMVRLYSSAELIGTGQVVGTTVYPSSWFTQVEIPTTHRLIDLVTDQLGSAAEVPLILRLHGLLRWRASREDDWHEDDLPNNNIQHQFSVARSKWYDQVLTPIRQSDFVYLEVAVPKGELGAPWRNALNIIRQAEAAYANGNDDSVFQRLRGALDALPGAKKDIFATIPNDVKRKAVDNLVKHYGEYLHVGRHVGAIGTDAEGKFPVDHIDADFAIAAMKVLLSYAARILEQGPSA